MSKYPQAESATMIRFYYRMAECENLSESQSAMTFRFRQHSCWELESRQMNGIYFIPFPFKACFLQTSSPAHTKNGGQRNSVSFPTTCLYDSIVDYFPIDSASTNVKYQLQIRPRVLLSSYDKINRASCKTSASHSRGAQASSPHSIESMGGGKRLNIITFIAIILICLISNIGVSVERNECSHFDELVSDKNSPIMYDVELNEYNIVYRDEKGCRNSILMQYCPICGSKAPKSKRECFFKQITEDEKDRINNLFKGLKKFDDVEKIYGKPNSWSISKSNEVDNSKKTFDIIFKAAVYTNLSNDADVWVLLNKDKTLHNIFILTKSIDEK